MCVVCVCGVCVWCVWCMCVVCVNLLVQTNISLSMYLVVSDKKQLFLDPVYCKSSYNERFKSVTSHLVVQMCVVEYAVALTLCCR